jgi:hypothetical protein
VPVVTETAYRRDAADLLRPPGRRVRGRRGRGDLRPFTYVGRPFSIAKADAYFAQMKALGFNSVRLMWMWEAVYPDSKLQPDRAYLEHFEALVRLAGEHDIYVLLNLHENLWSRNFYTHYSEWPVCEQCCRYVEVVAGSTAPSTRRATYTMDIICTIERMAECCPKGDIMNQLWSIFPNRTRAKSSASRGRTPREEPRRSIRARASATA